MKYQIMMNGFFIRFPLHPFQHGIVRYQIHNSFMPAFIQMYSALRMVIAADA